jgi:hypothetical protein
VYELLHVKMTEMKYVSKIQAVCILSKIRPLGKAKLSKFSEKQEFVLANDGKPNLNGCVSLQELSRKC